MKIFLHGITLSLLCIAAWVLLHIRSECFDIGADSIANVMTMYLILLAIAVVAYFIWCIQDYLQGKNR